MINCICGKCWLQRENPARRPNSRGKHVQTGTSGISGVIDTSKIEAMVAQLKAAAAQASGTVAAPSATDAASTAPKLDFANVLKSTLDGVNSAQQTSRQLSESYSLGNNNVNLSDVMIASQKASIALQTTLQVRNKLVSAYTEIMNMQV
ncbi:MAG: fliE [Herbaspirillum sp.]|jgi:flagellar hook-basal body complex protein FliE|nr:fliE [Herbaspirillum sp.]